MPRNTSRTAPDLSIVVPLFNEIGTLEELHRRLTQVVTLLGLDTEIIYVDDGSRDGTRDALAALAAYDPRVRAIRLARNYGQTAALAAGLVRTRITRPTNGKTRRPRAIGCTWCSTWSSTA